VLTGGYRVVLSRSSKERRIAMSESTESSVGQADRPWTQDEVSEFTQTLRTFRDGLPPRQRDAFDSILELGAQAVGGDDVQGYGEMILPVVRSFIPTILLDFHDRIEDPFKKTATPTKKLH
jgi:hypothetical protein